MTPEEFIRDTATKYIKDPSQLAVEDDRCHYRTFDGRTCAVGMWCSKDEHEVIQNAGMDGKSYPTLLKRGITVKALKGLPRDLVTSMQMWHDDTSGRYWNADGLSEQGWRRLNKIIDRYAPESNLKAELGALR